MYSKMLKQFGKRSLISILSESSKIHLLIKVLYRNIWFNLRRQYYLLRALNISLCYQLQCNFMSQYFRREIFQLCQFQYTCVRGHLHIESSSSLHENDARFQFQTQQPSTIYVKMPNLPKIDIYYFRYKIEVGCINQCA